MKNKDQVTNTENKIPWYLQPALICVLCALWIYIIPAIVGIVLLVLYYIRVKKIKETYKNVNNTTITYNTGIPDTNNGTIVEPKNIENKQSIPVPSTHEITTNSISDLRPLDKNSQNEEPSFTVPKMKETKERFPQNFVIVDVETTGFSCYSNEIIELAAIKVNNGEIIDTFSSLVKPSHSFISKRITQVTGITTNMVQDAPTIQEIFPSFLDFLGDYIIMAHNASFDIGFLNAACHNCNMAFLENTCFDTLKLSRKLFPFLESHKLDVLAEYFEILPEIKHRALADCETTLKVYTALLNAKTQKNCFDKITTDIYKGKRIVFSGKSKRYDEDEWKEICNKLGAKYFNAFYSSANAVVFSDSIYKRYAAGQENGKISTALRLQEEKEDFQILSEKEFLTSIGLE